MVRSLLRPHSRVLTCALPTARLKEREEIIRESWVRAMEAKIVRDNITQCYRLEGVNHTERCKDLADKYARMLQENKVRLLLWSLQVASLTQAGSQVRGYKHIDV